MSEKIKKYGKPDINIDWGTHTICDACGEKVARGIMPTIEHHEVCLGNRTEDAEFEVVSDKQLPNSELPLVDETNTNIPTDNRGA